jgi:hypothetical protein
MFSGGEVRQSGSALRSSDRRRTRPYATFRFLELLAWEAMSVFVAGIAVPTFLWSHAAQWHGLAMGSLRSLTVGRISFRYTHQEVAFAIFGALVGTAAAWALYAPTTFSSRTKVARALQQGHWRRFLPSHGHWRPGVGKAA